MDDKEIEQEIQAKGLTAPAENLIYMEGVKYPKWYARKWHQWHELGCP